MNATEHDRQLPCAAEQSPHIQSGAHTKPNHVAEDNSVARRGRLRVPSRPVQNCNPQKATAEHPEIRDQRGGRIRWNGTDADCLWGKYESEAEPGGGHGGIVGQYALARIGLVSLPAYLTIEDCAPTRFTGGGIRFYQDGTWEFAVAIQNDFGDTRFDNTGSFEQAGGALWFESDEGETFQGTIDEGGVVKIDYDYCQIGQTDIQLVSAQ